MSGTAIFPTPYICPAYISTTSEMAFACSRSEEKSKPVEGETRLDQLSRVAALYSVITIETESLSKLETLEA